MLFYLPLQMVFGSLFLTQIGNADVPLSTGIYGCNGCRTGAFLSPNI